jgi:acetyl esterase/lipase
MRKQLALFLTAAAVGIASAADAPIPLWPKGAPGEKGDIGPEADTSKPGEDFVAGKAVIRLGNVSSPTLAVYRPLKEKNTGAAVIVFPGGGYRILSIDMEGTEICDWLNSIGVTGVLVKYRVPVREGLPRYAAPLQDAQRAVGLVRHHAAAWGIDPKRIGVLGFSAGGHLAAAVSNNFDKRPYEPQDEADSVSCRPDFSVLIYPAYLTVRDEGDRLAPEVTVTAKTPPAILIQTEDDSVRVENSLFYYLALKNVKVPAEMHLYSNGGHGYGLRHAGKLVTTWPARVEDWMRSMGFLSAAN